MSRTLVLAAALSLVCEAALAQTRAQPSAPVPTQAPAVEDVEAQVIDGLVVTGRLPGPAWWRVSDQDTTVYVMGLPDALPKGMAWDQTILNRRLAGADRLITPPVYRATANPLSLPLLLFSAYRAVKADPASDPLPPELQARLKIAAETVGKNGEAYGRFRPWVAGLLLTSQYRRRVGLDYAEPLRTIRDAARRAKVEVAPAYSVSDKASELVQQVKAVTDELGRACLDASVEEVEAGDAAVRGAADAWAKGNVRIALAARRSSELCYGILPGAGSVKRVALGKEADAIAAALSRPGHAVAVLPLRAILAKDGVLDRLRARGYTVQARE